MRDHRHADPPALGFSKVSSPARAQASKHTRCPRLRSGHPHGPTLTKERHIGVDMGAKREAKRQSRPPSRRAFHRTSPPDQVTRESAMDFVQIRSHFSSGSFSVASCLPPFSSYWGSWGSLSRGTESLDRRRNPPPPLKILQPRPQQHKPSEHRCRPQR